MLRLGVGDDDQKPRYADSDLETFSRYGCDYHYGVGRGIRGSALVSGDTPQGGAESKFSPSISIFTDSARRPTYVPGR